MKKIFLPFLFVASLVGLASCAGMRNGTISEAQAADAIRELLNIGVRDGVQRDAFSKDAVMRAVFPEGVRKVLNTVDQLGLTGEVDRFSTTLSNAAQKTADRSVPIFASAIARLPIRDARQLLRSGNTAATDYLRSQTGDSLRRAITPIMAEALAEYNAKNQWDKLPVTLGGKDRYVNVAGLMAGVVTEAMLRKMAEKEQEIRTNRSARTTPLLRRVFGN